MSSSLHNNRTDFVFQVDILKDCGDDVLQNSNCSDNTTGYHCAAADITPTPFHVVPYQYRVHDPSTIPALERAVLRKVAEGLGLTACADRSIRSLVTGVSLEPRDHVVAEAAEECESGGSACSVLVKGGMTIFLDSDEYKESTVNDFFWAVLQESMVSTAAASSSSTEGGESGMILVENWVLTDDAAEEEAGSLEVSSPAVGGRVGDTGTADSGTAILPSDSSSANGAASGGDFTSTGSPGDGTVDSAGAGASSSDATATTSNPATSGGSSTSNSGGPTSTGAETPGASSGSSGTSSSTNGEEAAANAGSTEGPSSNNRAGGGESTPATDTTSNTVAGSSSGSNSAAGGSTTTSTSTTNGSSNNDAGSGMPSSGGGSFTEQDTGSGSSATNNNGGETTTTSSSTTGDSDSSSTGAVGGTTSNPLNGGGAVSANGGISTASENGVVTPTGGSDSISGASNSLHSSGGAFAGSGGMIPDPSASTAAAIDSGGPSLGVILGGMFGGVGLLILLCCCCCCCFMWRRRRRNPGDSLLISPQSSYVSGTRGMVALDPSDTAEADGNGQLASLDSLAAKDRGGVIFGGEQTEEDTTSGGDEEEGIYITEEEEDSFEEANKNTDNLAGTGYISAGNGGYDSDIHFDSDVEGMRVATIDVDDLMTSDDGGVTTDDDDVGATTDDSAPSGMRRRGLLQALDETSTNTSSYDEEIMGVLGHVPSPSADSEDDFPMDMDRSSAESPRTGLQMS